MFVTNAFDSILATLGADVGGYSPSINPMTLAMSMIGIGIAMGVFSAMIGVYLSERAERLREIRDLERKVQASLKGSVYWKIAKIAPLYIALWSGLGVLLFPSMIAVPYVLSYTYLLTVKSAFLLSLVIALGILAWLGFYLSSISGDPPLRSISKTVLAGLGGIALVEFLKEILHITITAP
jgi:predicted membrane protein (TIGR00267 family)